MITDANTTWIVQEVGVSPRHFLAADGTWGGAAKAQRFSTEAEAWMTVCPEGTSGLAIRMNYLSRRMGDEAPVSL